MEQDSPGTAATLRIGQSTGESALRGGADTTSGAPITSGPKG